MATLFRSYPTQRVAQQAIEALTAAGVPDHDVHLLTGARLHDVRHEAVGAFYGTLAPDALVGAFAGPQRPRRAGRGTFAGDADRQRQGSFADVEHGDRDLAGALRRCAVGGDAAAHVLDDLHAGHAVVVAEVAEITPSEAAGRLDALARAA